jgi:DNA-binding FadR family transcriptional regulator
MVGYECIGGRQLECSTRERTTAHQRGRPSSRESLRSRSLGEKTVTWERDSLLVKAVLFFERAFAEAPQNPLFGLWCSLGLELLARSALASVSPTLLAEPDRDHRYLLHALNRADRSVQPQSTGATQVFTLCQRLLLNFRQKTLLQLGR